MALGLYIHFPYCLRHCPYCDFAVEVSRVVPEERYARAVLAELELRLASDDWPSAPLGSIYFGGGTPSLWSPEWIAHLLEGVAKRLTLLPDAEITLEANPERLTLDRLAGYRSAGVARLSLGAQSFSLPVLRALGRAHGPRQVVHAFTAARDAGFDNVTLDLIYGVHGESLAQVEEDVRRAVALEPEHLSAYALTLDTALLAEPVVLSRRLARGEVALPPDEAVVAMAETVAEACERGGLRQYEISNFARVGRESRHNQLYWRGDDCVALGCGAVGFARRGPRRGVRYTNHRRAEAWWGALDRGELPEVDREELGAAELATERVMAGLRLTEGIDLRATLEGLGVAFGDRDTQLARMEREGLLTRQGDRVALTRKGRHLHSSIVATLS